MNVSRLPFSNFLRDVIYEPEQGQAPRGQGLGVLDYCDDINYELNDFDFGMLDNWNGDGTGDRPTAPQSTTSPQTEKSAIDADQMGHTLAKIWLDSPWRWVPDKRDHRFVEAGNLPLPLRDIASQHFQESQQRVDRVVQDSLDLSNRDRILSIVLAMCQNNQMRSRVASSFPSVDMMDILTRKSKLVFGSLFMTSGYPFAAVYTAIVVLVE